MTKARTPLAPRLAASLALAALLLPSASSAKGASILGGWEVVAGEQRGKRMAVPPNLKVRWVFKKGGTLIQTHAVKGKGKPRTVKGRFKLDANTIELTLGAHTEVMLVSIKGKALTLGKPDKGMRILLQRPGSGAVKVSRADLKRTKRELALYLRKTKALEAREGLDKLSAGATTYYSSDKYNKDGNLKPHRFPPGKASWTPSGRCCKQPGKRCKADAKTWSAEPWKSLYFQPSSAHHFQYRYSSKGEGKRSTVTIEARADLDCDGRYSHYKISGKIGPEARPAFGKVITKDPLE